MIDSSSIRLSQQRSSKIILERVGFGKANKVGTPLDPNVILFKSTEEERLENVKDYQAIVGSLMYLVIGSRADLAYTVPLLSQFSSCPNQTHLQSAERILRYLAGTSDWDLFYPNETCEYLEVYVNASYANDPYTRRSISGYLIRLGDAAISWNSKQQRSVALSTTEAEYMAMSLAARQITWTKFGLTQLYQKFDTLLFIDNNGAKGLARNSRIHGRSKHIDVHYHYVRDFELLHVNSTNNLADLLTKLLPKATHFGSLSI